MRKVPFFLQPLIFRTSKSSWMGNFWLIASLSHDLKSKSRTWLLIPSLVLHLLMILIVLHSLILLVLNMILLVLYVLILNLGLPIFLNLGLHTLIKRRAKRLIRKERLSINELSTTKKLNAKKHLCPLAHKILWHLSRDLKNDSIH